MDKDSMQFLKEFEEALNFDRIYVAFELLKKLEMKAMHNEAVAEELKQRADIIKDCQQRYTMVKMHLDDMNRDKGWALISNKRGISGYQRVGDNKFVANRTVTSLQLKDSTPAEAFIKMVSLIAEIDLMPRYFPSKLLSSSEITQEISEYSKYVHMKFNAGALLSKRDAVALGTGYDLCENGEIVITFETLPVGTDERGYVVSDPEPGYTRIDVKGAFYFRLVDDAIDFKVISNVDVKLNLIPQSVIQFLSRYLWYEFVANFKKAYNNFAGSIWEKRIKEKAEFYENILKRVEQSLSNRTR